MLAILTLLVGFALFFLILSDHLHMWQRKEYRLDRLWATRDTRDIRRRLYFFLAYLVLFMFSVRLALAILLIAYFILAVRRGIFRPDPTLKLAATASLTVIFSLLLFATLFLTSESTAYQVLAAVVAFLPLLIATAIPISNLITSWRKRQYISQARAHRETLSLPVVGITGSFGKTSVKYFAQQLIPQAVVSKDHRNSEYIISRDLLEQLTNHTDAYILEMGAYKSGEINDLCQLTQPTIGVITTIGNQHQGVFGSPAAILKAKWELAEAVTDGTLILNGDDELLRRQAHQHAGKIIWYGSAPDNQISARNVRAYPDHSQFNLHINRQSFPVTIPLPGAAALQNVLAAVAIACALRVDPAHIISKLADLQPFERTMELIATGQGNTAIDDSYSAGEASMKNALDHLDLYPTADKIIVLVPIIELGDISAQVHRRLGQRLADTGAQVFVYGTEYQSEITAGFKQGHGQYLKFFTHPASLIQSLRTVITPQSVTLLEGRIPEVVRQAIIRDS